MTTNAALNKRRGKRFEVETSLEDLLPTYTDDGHRAGERSFLLSDWSALPDEELLSAEGRREIARALDALPAAYRTVFVLRDVDGLSNEETAAALGESVASVKSRLHRARMALRERLTQWYAAGQRLPGDGRTSGSSPLNRRSAEPSYLRHGQTDVDVRHQVDTPVTP